MTVIYADSVFLVNTLMDYLVILVTGRLAGIPLKRKRFFAAAVLGGFYALAAVIPALSVLLSGPVKILVWVLIIRVAYGSSQQFMKLILLFGIVSCTLAGVIFGLGMFFASHLSPEDLPEVCRILILCGIGSCFLCSVLFNGLVQTRVEGTLVPVYLSIAGSRLVLTALLDTGNQLRDAATGQPILVVSPNVLQSVLPDRLNGILSSNLSPISADLPEQIHSIAPELCPRLTPYRALGVSSGMLLTLQTDWIKIRNNTYPNASVAIAPFDLGLGYSALWGGTLKGESTE